MPQLIFNFILVTILDITPNILANHNDRDSPAYVVEQDMHKQ